MEYALGAKPRVTDTDEDAISDGDEYHGVTVIYDEPWVNNSKVYADPLKNDTDDDNKDDYDEIYGMTPSDPNDDDSDDDFLKDGDDPRPTDPDSDDDGWLDGPEYDYWNVTRGYGDSTATTNMYNPVARISLLLVSCSTLHQLNY